MDVHGNESIKSLKMLKLKYPSVSQYLHPYLAHDEFHDY